MKQYGLERNNVWHELQVDRGERAMGRCGHVFAVIKRASAPDSPNRLCHGCLWRQQRAAPPTQE